MFTCILISSWLTPTTDKGCGESRLEAWQRRSIFAHNPYICSNYYPLGHGQCRSALCWHRRRDLDTHTHTQKGALIKQLATRTIPESTNYGNFPRNVNKYFVARLFRESFGRVTPQAEGRRGGTVKTLDKRCLPCAVITELGYVPK